MRKLFLRAGNIGLRPVEIPRNIFHAAISRSIWSLFNRIHFMGKTVSRKCLQSVEKWTCGGWSAIRNFYMHQSISLIHMYIRLPLHMPLPIRCYLVSVYHNAGGRRIKAFESGGDKGNCWLALATVSLPRSQAPLCRRLSFAIHHTHTKSKFFENATDDYELAFPSFEVIATFTFSASLAKSTNASGSDLIQRSSTKQLEEQEYRWRHRDTGCLELKRIDTRM